MTVANFIRNNNFVYSDDDTDDDYDETNDDIITDEISCNQLYEYVKTRACEELRNYKFIDEKCHMTLINLLVEYKKPYSSWLKTVEYLVEECKINPFEQSYQIGYTPDDSQIVTSEMFPDKINTWKELFHINK